MISIGCNDCVYNEDLGVATDTVPRYVCFAPQLGPLRDPLPGSNTLIHTGTCRELKNLCGQNAIWFVRKTREVLES